MFITAVWITEHQVDLFAALGTGGTAGAVGVGIISFFKRRGQSAIDALEAVIPWQASGPRRHEGHASRDRQAGLKGPWPPDLDVS